MEAHTSLISTLQEEVKSPRPVLYNEVQASQRYTVYLAWGQGLTTQPSGAGDMTEYYKTCQAYMRY